MSNIGEIIRYNRLANWAIKDRDIDAAAKYLMHLHRLERKDRCGIGMYRIRNT